MFEEFSSSCPLEFQGLSSRSYKVDRTMRRKVTKIRKRTVTSAHPTPFRLSMSASADSIVLSLAGPSPAMRDHTSSTPAHTLSFSHLSASPTTHQMICISLYTQKVRGGCRRRSNQGYHSNRMQVRAIHPTLDSFLPCLLASDHSVKC